MYVSSGRLEKLKPCQDGEAHLSLSASLIISHVHVSFEVDMSVKYIFKNRRYRVI